MNVSFSKQNFFFKLLNMRLYRALLAFPFSNDVLKKSDEILG